MKYGVVCLLLVSALVCGCPKEATVPDLVGMPLEEAVSALTAAGLAAGSAAQQFSETVPEGSVISQNPRGGASVPPDSAVDLVLSLGPEPVGPRASFNATPGEGYAPLTVLFADTSSRGTSVITNWAWDFGDGTSSAEVNPRHVYADPGTYAAALTVTTAVGSDTASTVIDVSVRPVGPVASFTASTTRGALPLAVTFADTSTAGTAAIASWAWDFGDGASSAEQNPAHVYSNAGTYTVSLAVATVVSSDTASRAGLIVVDKATPLVSAWPVAGSLVYGQSLASSSLTGGAASVPGTFVFDAPSIVPNAGTFNAALRFMPADAANYVTVSGVAQVHVAKAEPVVTAWPSAGGLVYGQALGASSLSGGAASTPGTFTFDAPSAVPPAGVYAAAVSFVPAIAANYINVSGTVNVNVSKAIPEVAVWPAASAIAYGQTLASSSLTGGSASATGTFAFDAPSSILNAGTHNATITFVPTDTANYETVSGVIEVVVNKAMPSVTAWPTAGAITYGQTLASSALTGGASSVPGTFAFDAPSSVPNAGTYEATITFTPTGTANYETVSGAVQVAVNKAVPSVTTWPSAGAITYGQTLASSTLTGGASSVPGTFAFDVMSTSPNAGAHEFAITFTPTDTANYETVSGSIEVAVDKAVPSVSTWPSTGAITYGQTLAASALTGGVASVPGAFDFDAPSTMPSAGMYAAAVTFTPADAANYERVVGSIEVAVNKAVPSVTMWPTASAIVYTQTLASSVLTGGGASVPGTFAFDTPLAAPAAGTYVATVTFTATDAVDYETVSGTVAVQVNKATPTVSTWPTPSAITYGDALASSTLSGGTASVPGTFAFDAPSTTPNAGTFAAAVTFAPTDSENYEAVSGTVNVMVNKALPQITAWPLADAIGYGETLASATLTGGAASVPGTFAFNVPSTMPGAGTYAAPVTFTPADASNYVAVPGAVEVVVRKAMPGIGAWPSASGITYGETLASSALTGGTPSVPGTFAFDDPSIAPAAGVYNAVVNFTPADSNNYSGLSGSVAVAVFQATPVVTEWPAASFIVFGQTLAESTLTGGAASVPGAFAFDDPGAAPVVGMYEAAVRFVPADSANFSSVLGTVAVEVQGGVPTASFDASPASGPAPLSVAFTDTSTERGLPITSWSWDFGDGSSSNEQNPSHVYEEPGLYTVSLAITTPNQSNMVTKQDCIAVAPPLGTVLYVKPDGAGDGASWETASGSIQDAVDAAAIGGAEVWVAAGAYTATLDALAKADTTYVLRMAQGVEIYGGFAGVEVERDARDWESNLSIIDGEDTYPCVYGADGAMLDGFVIQRGHATAQGGGMLNVLVSPTVRHCAFVRNKAGRAGGMYNHHASPVVAECAFVENEDGAMFNAVSSPEVTGCSFVRNKAYLGGGIWNTDHCSPTIERCVFFENGAMDGGAIGNENYAGPYIFNCTFSANRAGQGSAVYNYSYSSPRIANCICWDDASGSSGDEIYNSESTSVPVVWYSCVRGGYAGEGNIDADPLLAGTDGSQGRVFPSSPCIDAGMVIPDMKGGPAPKTGGVDMGAYELDDSDGDGMSDAWETEHFGDLSAGPDDDPDGDGLANVEESVYGTDPLAADTDVDGMQDGEEQALGWDPALPSVVRLVDADNASGMYDGQSWDSAYVTIQDAVDDVHAMGEGEVWVAAGTYTSSVSAAAGATLHALSAANNAYVVGMSAGVYLYGGFDATEANRDQRDWRANPCVIDGEGVRGCVYGANRSTLDGFILEHGDVTRMRSGAWGGKMGGALHCDLATMSVANCTFRDNVSQAGGAMSNFFSDVFVSNCVLVGNIGLHGGAAVVNFFSPSTWTNCIFAENLTEDIGFAGGAIFDLSGSEYSAPILSAFSESYIGPGSDFPSPAILSAVNCTFTRNHVEGSGGIVLYGTSAYLANDILWGNAANGGHEVSRFTGLGQVSAVNSCIYGGYAGAGNIDRDPLFVDPYNGDYTLAAESPCIDTGVADGAPSADLDGVARPQGLGFDMGAYESHYTGSALVANFAAASTVGVLPFTAVFSDFSASVLPIVQWQWDFGDGGASAEQNPSHVYERAGSYTVTLTVFTSEASDTKARTGYISVNGLTPTVFTWPTASSITRGQFLRESQLTGGAASVDGTFAFAYPNARLGPGTYTEAVIFTPADMGLYRTVKGYISILVR